MLNLEKLTIKYSQKEGVEKLLTLSKELLQENYQYHILIIAVLLYIKKETNQQTYKKQEDSFDKKSFFIKQIRLVSAKNLFPEYNNVDLKKEDNFVFLMKILESIDEEFYEKSYTVLLNHYSKEPLLSDIFFDLLVRGSRDFLPNYYHNFTPKLIAEKIALKITPELKNIADIGCGIGGILSEVMRLNKNTDKTFEAFEINYEVGLLGKMYLSFFVNKLRYHICDVFDYFKANELVQFDCVISGIPFGNKQEGKFLELIIELTKEKAIILVPENVLYGSSNVITNFRKNIIDNDWLEEVISYPNEINKPFNQVKTSLLIINKKKLIKDRGKVKFEKVTSNNIDINVFTSKDDKNIYFDNSTFIKSISEIINNEYLINLNRYEIPDEYKILGRSDIENNKTIDDIFYIFQGKTYPEEQITLSKNDNPFVNAGDLAIDTQLPFLNNEKVTYYLDSKFSTTHLKYATAGDILITGTGEKFKPTLVKENKVYFSRHILCLKLKDEFKGKILPEYLAFYLRNDSIRNQHEKYSVHSHIQLISPLLLKKIVLVIPTLIQQMEYVNNQLISLFEKQEKKSLEEKERDTIEKASTLEHTLGNSINVIGSDVQSLVRFFNSENYNPITNSKARAEVVEKSRLSNIFERILIEVQSSRFALQNINDWRKLSKKNLLKEKTNLKAFFEESIEGFQIGKDILSEVKCSESVEADIDRERFKILIRNFLVNSMAHAFKNENIIPKRLIFDIFQNEDDSIQIEIKNNGKPISEDFDFKYYLNSDSTNKGLKLINNIVKAHNGLLEVLPRESSLKLGFGAFFIIQINKIDYNAEN